MLKPILAALIAATAVWSVTEAMAQSTTIDTFEEAPETRWRFFADTVMGGVSSGTLAFATENGASYARMTGQVSTANNGGFIQFRTDLPAGLPKDATGIRVVVRGENGPYFLHLRTGGTVLPWQYYQARFDVSTGWSEVRLPLTAFRPSGRLLRDTPRASGLTSVAVVAFGRDHSARIDVAEIGYY